MGGQFKKAPRSYDKELKKTRRRRRQGNTADLERGFGSVSSKTSSKLLRLGLISGILLLAFSLAGLAMLMPPKAVASKRPPLETDTGQGQPHDTVSIKADASLWKGPQPREKSFYRVLEWALVSS